MEERPPLEQSGLRCARCDLALVRAKATAGYLGQTFPIELDRCPGCGAVFVPAELALGKMLQVEQLLEDK